MLLGFVEAEPTFGLINHGLVPTSGGSGKSLCPVGALQSWDLCGSGGNLYSPSLPRLGTTSSSTANITSMSTCPALSPPGRTQQPWQRTKGTISSSPSQRKCRWRFNLPGCIIAALGMDCSRSQPRQKDVLQSGRDHLIIIMVSTNH